MTFGAGYICSAFGCSDFRCWLSAETNRAQRPLRTEGYICAAETNRFLPNVRCRLKKMQEANVLVSPHAESAVVGYFISSTLKGAPSEMTASMGSSHHVFFFHEYRRTSTLHNISIWLLDVRSPRSDAPCHGGDRQGAFIQTQGNFMSVLSLGVNMTFTQPLEALVLTCFERVYGSRNRIDWLERSKVRF